MLTKSQYIQVKVSKACVKLQEISDINQFRTWSLVFGGCVILGRMVHMLPISSLKKGRMVFTECKLGIDLISKLSALYLGRIQLIFMGAREG